MLRSVRRFTHKQASSLPAASIAFYQQQQSSFILHRDERVRAFSQFTGSRTNVILKKTENNLPFKVSKKYFSNVWGERTMSWISESIRKHMDSHKEDYEFDTDDIPFLKSKEEFHQNHKRYAIVTPCIKQATSSYMIDVLLQSGYHVTGVADPTANLNVIQSRFRLRDANVSKKEETNYTVNIIDSESNPAMYIEQRPLESFVVKAEQWGTFDVIFDEMPLLDMATEEELNGKSPFCQTTVFGHALRPGGLVYLQTEGAKKYNEKIELINRIKSYYPESHFAMVETRKTPFTRQFLFLKVDHTHG